MTNKSIEELFRLAKSGDKKAREQIIINNQRLVFKLAQKYKSDLIDFDTAIQEGNIGLIKAVDRFELDRGLQFSTYAYHLIRSQIVRHIRDAREDVPYRLKRCDNEIYVKIQEAKDTLAKEFHGEPSNMEISLWLGIDQDKLEEVVNVVENSTSLQNTKYYNKDGYDDILLIESIENQENISEEQITKKIIVEKALKHLTERQRKVIKLRYYQDLTQNSISKLLNVSQVQVSRIEREAIKRLKEVI